MKKVLIPMLALATLASCSNNGEFTVNGKIDPALLGQLQGTVIYMAPAAEKMVPVDSLTIDTVNTFTLKGIAAEPELYNLYMQNGSVIGQFIGESGKLNCDINMQGVKVSGSTLNDSNNEMSDAIAALSQDLNAAFMKAQAEGTEEARAAAEKLYEEAMVKANGIATEYYKANGDNAFGIIALNQVLMTSENMDLATLDSLLALGSDKIRNDWRIKETRENYEHKEATKEGKQFVDFEGQTLEGQPAKLSDFVGKGDFVLVDFWASWCGPCKGEIKYLKEINEYAEGKNLKVLSVSVWDKIENITAAAEAEGMEWNHLFDSNGVATPEYGINGIPQIMLISPDGIILKRDLRGEEMVNYVKEMVK